MKTINDILEDINMLIEAYNDTALNDGEALNEILKTLSTNLFLLDL